VCEKLVFIQVYEYPEASGGGGGFIGFSLAFVLVTRDAPIIQTLVKVGQNELIFAQSWSKWN
jgi:hypothetical protein